MMMRFLGWGVGHLNPADFPHEADALIATPRDRQLPAAVIAAPSESGSALTTTAHMEGDDKAEESSGAEDGEVEGDLPEDDDEDELDWEY